MPVIVAYPAFKNRATNPYQSLLYTEMQKLGWAVYDLDVALKKWIRADILHLHWPDGFVFHRSFVKTLWRSLLLFGILRLFRVKGARVVWTIHNFRSHENFHPRFERWFWGKFYGHLNGWVALNQYTVDQLQRIPALRDLPGKVIRHGLYPRFERGKETSLPPLRKKTLLFFGKLREYKEIPRLIEAFEQLNDADVSLVIAGQSNSPAVDGYLESKKGVSGLTIINRFIPDDELSQFLHTSDMVVIPYDKTLNSGAVFLALGYSKTILAPRTPVLKEIQHEFSSARVRLYDPPFTAESMRKALGESSSGGEDPEKVMLPDGYTWPNIARAHECSFKGLLSA